MREHVSQSRGGNKRPMWPGWAGGPAPRCLLGEGEAVVSVANPASVLLQDALNDTKDSETKLKASQGVCNETMTALWEECKPCLKQTCMKFYARVCRSGSGLVGQQVTRGPASSAQPGLWLGSEEN